MPTIRATVRCGKLETAERIDLPDGTELLITVPDSGDWWAAFEPLDITPAEEADAKAWLRAADKLNRRGDLFP